MHNDNNRNAIMSHWKTRQPGEESPYFALGPFKIRLPFLHYRFELPDYLQGLLMCAVDLAAIPLMTELLGMPFEAALAIVMLNGLLYLVHHLLGDPGSFPAGSRRPFHC